MSYEILNVKQGTKAWLQERMKRVTASQVSTLFGINEYQKLDQLIEEKLTGKEAEVDSYKQILFQRGHDAEHAARQWVEADTSLKFPPAVLISKRCPDLMASLDGFNPEANLIFEAKYMGAKALLEVKAGKIKAHHMAQVQAQLLASGADKCIYFATTDDGESAIVEIKPDFAMHEKIQAAVESFMKEIIELSNLLALFEHTKAVMINKQKAPLKVLASGAKDPFRVRAR